MLINIIGRRINRTIGASRWSETDEIDLTRENLVKVLCDRSSYHDHYTFSPEDVKILSIESVSET